MGAIVGPTVVDIRLGVLDGVDEGTREGIVLGTIVGPVLGCGLNVGAVLSFCPSSATLSLQRCEKPVPPPRTIEKCAANNGREIVRNRCMLFL